MTGSLRNPHEVTVFIPTHDVLVKSGEKYGRENRIILSSKEETEINIIEMIIHRKYFQEVVDENGKLINSVQDLIRSPQSFISLSDSNKKIYIPVTINPREDFMVYQNN